MAGKDQEYASAFSLRGETKYRLGDFEGAIEDYTEAIRIEPDQMKYNNRGLAKMENGDYDGAISDFNEALFLWQNDTSFISRSFKDYSIFSDCSIFFNRGIAKLYLQDLEGAIEDWSQAINRKPDYADAYFNRSASYIDLAHHEGIEPGHHEYYLRAKADVLIALKLGDEGALYNLACAEALLLEEDEALRHLSESLDRGLITLYLPEIDWAWDHFKDNPGFLKIIQAYKTESDKELVE